MLLTDTHAHLDYQPLDSDTDGVLARAQAHGVGRIISVGTGIESSRRCIVLAERHDAVSAVIGIHPNHVLDEPSDCFTVLRDMAAHPQVVAIGETGLDYFRLPSENCEANIAAQKESFRHHLALAAEMRLNVVVHQREAWEDTLAILADYSVRAVFHCFVGTPEQAEMLAALGHCVSFTGIVSFKNAIALKATAAAVASGTFMLETDCPYLAPAPHRGKTCEPWHTSLIAREMAALRHCTPEQIAAETTSLANIFFSKNGSSQMSGVC